MKVKPTVRKLMVGFFYLKGNRETEIVELSTGGKCEIYMERYPWI